MACEDKLSFEELKDFSRNSVDCLPNGPIMRPRDNAGLSDEELVSRIRERNEMYKSTYLLRLEYFHRLISRE